MPNGCTTLSLLARNVQSGMHMLYSVAQYILYTFVLQLITYSTMYNIVPFCVLFSNFGDINTVYMYFYTDSDGKFVLMKVLKFLTVLT